MRAVIVTLLFMVACGPVAPFPGYPDPDSGFTSSGYATGDLSETGTESATSTTGVGGSSTSGLPLEIPRGDSSSSSDSSSSGGCGTRLMSTEQTATVKLVHQHDTVLEPIDEAGHVYEVEDCLPLTVLFSCVPPTSPTFQHYLERTWDSVGEGQNLEILELCAD